AACRGHPGAARAAADRGAAAGLSAVWSAGLQPRFGFGFSRARRQNTKAGMHPRTPNFPRRAMFTGLVEALGTVVELTAAGTGSRLVLREPGCAPHLTLGESVCVNGACLTVVAHDAETFTFEAGPETL